MKADNEDVAVENAELAELDAPDRVRWAAERFGDGLVMSTSFGLQSAVMLHLVSSIKKEVPIVFVDTGYLFPETYEYADKLRARLKIEPCIYSSPLTPAYQEARYGKLWEQGVEGMTRYNYLNKREPMDRALKELKATAWLAGLRRTQGSSRAERSFIERQNGFYKIYPILDWDDKTTYRYLPENDLPYHPLEGMGYDSLGDIHSTRKLEPGMNPEDTRHGGHNRECGLHVDLPAGHDFSV